MFYNLPMELQNYIYSFDDTYKEKYNKNIKEIQKLPNFDYYNIEHDIYKFSMKMFGIINYYTIVHGKNYKDALKNAKLSY